MVTFDPVYIASRCTFVEHVVNLAGGGVVNVLKPNSLRVSLIIACPQGSFLAGPTGNINATAGLPVGSGNPALAYDIGTHPGLVCQGWNVFPTGATQAYVLEELWNPEQEIL
jgi:hypothetical protein